MSQELIMLDESAKKRLIKAINSDLEQLLWLADWLLHLNIFSDAQIYDVLNFVKSGIEDFAEALKEHRTITTTICVCDSRWISMSNGVGFLDTQTGEVIDALPQPVVTVIFCDLCALLLRMEHRKRMFNGNTSERPPAENSAQAGEQPAVEASTETAAANTTAI